ncbi:MAG: hypothetical protein SGJ18_03235 [Pseudomonadota bacterium]|nr:hypothetical protein [Pseudomonadota bacterium]
MKTIASYFICLNFFLALSSWSFAAPSATTDIAKAVKMFSPLAQSGVEKFKLKPAKSVRDMMLALAFKSKGIENESDFTWVGTSSEAWDADTSTWGEASMKEAYDYITEIDESYLEVLNEEGNEKEKAKVMSHVKKAKDHFKYLLNTGVKFGVAPMGAVQCGVTFAALAIIDPYTGTVYVFAKEGSGC